jgi:hypothetical protein
MFETDLAGFELGDSRDYNANKVMLGLYIYVA